jgi:hypothetical protein
MPAPKVQMDLSFSHFQLIRTIPLGVVDVTAIAPWFTNESGGVSGIEISWTVASGWMFLYIGWTAITVVADMLKSSAGLRRVKDSLGD